MPPLPRISVPSLSRLAQELRFAPRDAIIRDLERIEALAPQIDPAAEYPEEWIVYRVTGFRADAPTPPTPGASVLVRGSDLLADLSALVERLSTAARLTLGELGDRTITIDTLMASWKLSRKTVERLRRQGLVARRAVGADGKWRLAFSTTVIDAFAGAHPDLLGRAAAYTRMAPALRARVLRRAALYRRAGLTLNQAALRIARRYQRSHEAIRQQLIGNDRRATASGRPPIFGWRGPIRPSHAEHALAAASRGMEPRRSARGLKRSPASLRRAMNLIRAERLRALGLRSHDAPVPATLAGAPLDGSHASADIGAEGITDLLAFITAARKREVPIGVVERARAHAYRELLARAGAWTASLDPASPAAESLDRIETALRWASRLKAELVRAHLALAVQTIEERAALRLDDQRAPRAVELVELGLHACCRAIDAFEPSKGGRLAAPINLFLTREIARWLKEPRPPQVDIPGRATPRLSSGIHFPDWTRAVSPWQQWLEPDPAVRPRADAVTADARRVMALRMGWPEWSLRGGPGLAPRPHTCAEIAHATGLSPIAVSRLERLALREALAPTDTAP